MVNYFTGKSPGNNFIFGISSNEQASKVCKICKSAVECGIFDLSCLRQIAKIVFRNDVEYSILDVIRIIRF